MDFASAISSVAVAAADTGKATHIDGASLDLAIDMSSVPPAQPLWKRRAVLFGGAGVIVVVAILAVAMGSHTSTPDKRSASAQTSLKKAEPPLRESPSVAAAPAPTPAQPPQSAEAVASSGPVPSAAPAEATDEEVKIAINVKPDGSSLVYKGKVVGRTPFILKQPRGEKRSYEIGKPGYATRRVVINGNERTIGFELGIDTPHPDSL